ncbi:putative NUDIX family hydrolase [Aspergillus clavatus NRRL 1]|uniref:NUDIX family hydrolase, putative n=1 Tax=Aspergillus clavatus (strain ATCC 1007 / CBS 513.65 / DSM 816 / NCTC 3887 / NRRL 1 / QM 1276 / 107) TaxID=344612 RepID=A1CAN1_ASPCL|nr:NUDIX family hydrolase, putative [Aspergillus clavatus NRRL 1]EAW12799.1 NUDIX family hydrolase, putative [Aspergillus clavatus NRRL 1]
MRHRLWLSVRHLRPSSVLVPVRSMSSFTIPTTDKTDDASGSIPVNSIADLNRDDLSRFPAFQIWLSTLQRSLKRQQHPSHEFNHDPYVLRKIDIQSVDHFKDGRLGFVKLKADVSNGNGETLPGTVFLRGGSVGMLIILQPDDAPLSNEDSKRAILTIQPRIPAGSLAFPEIPAGMLDDSGTFAGAAAKEIEEETGLTIPQNELVDMTSLALQSISEPEDGESLQKAVYPSPGGSDEFIPLFLCQKRMPRKDIESLQGRLTGLRQHGEKITLKIVPLKDLWKEALRDGKTLAAWALYNGLKQDRRI